MCLSFCFSPSLFRFTSCAASDYFLTRRLFNTRIKDRAMNMNHLMVTWKEPDHFSDSEDFFSFFTISKRKREPILKATKRPTNRKGERERWWKKWKAKTPRNLYATLLTIGSNRWGLEFFERNLCGFDFGLSIPFLQTFCFEAHESELRLVWPVADSKIQIWKRIKSLAFVFEMYIYVCMYV